MLKQILFIIVIWTTSIVHNNVYSYVVEKVSPLSQHDKDVLRRAVFNGNQVLALYGETLNYEEVYYHFTAIKSLDKSSYNICKASAVREVVAADKLRDSHYIALLPQSNFHFVYKTDNHSPCDIEHAKQGIELYHPIPEAILHKILSEQKELLKLALQLADSSSFPESVKKELILTTTQLIHITLHQNTKSFDYNYKAEFNTGLSLSFQIKDNEFNVLDIELSIR